jgi:hypothetical protein
MFRRSRIRRTGSGFKIDLPDEERALLGHLLPQLRQVLEDPADDRARRLFPTAYPDDPERDAEYQRYMRDELVSSRLAAIERFEASLSDRMVSEEQLSSWLQSVNAIRLVLGTLLDVSEDEDVSHMADDHPDIGSYALYGYLSVLLEEIVQALAGR